MLNASKIYQELRSELDILDKDRLRYYNRVRPFQYLLWLVLWVIGPFLIIRYNLDALQDFLFPDEDMEPVLFAYAGAFFASLVLFLIAHYSNIGKFKKLFTDKIAPRIIEGLGPDFKYTYEKGWTSEEVSQSGLFGAFSSFQSQDLVTGTIDGSKVKFAEITVYRTSKTSGSSSSNTSKLFDGVMFEGELNVAFPTAIWIVGPRHYETLEKRGKTELNIDHPELKKYRFYADDSEKGEKVLQAFVLDKIAALNKKLDKEKKITFGHIGYRFEKNQIQVAVPTFDKFMEPRLSRSMHDVTFIEEQVVLLNSLCSLMKDLTLQ